jgi:hypothetical protein
MDLLEAQSHRRFERRPTVRASPDLPPEEINKIGAELLGELHSANEAHQQAKKEAAKLYLVKKDLRLGHPDGWTAIRTATRIERVALRRYVTALRAFHKFTLRYRPPLDLRHE